MNPIEVQKSLFRSQVKKKIVKVHKYNSSRGLKRITDLSHSLEILILMDTWIEDETKLLERSDMIIILDEEVNLFIEQKPNFYINNKN